jgi:hypothetical protein
VREFVQFDTRQHFGPSRVITEDMVFDLVVVRESEVAVRALVHRLIHGFIVGESSDRRIEHYDTS